MEILLKLRGEPTITFDDAEESGNGESEDEN